MFIVVVLLLTFLQFESRAENDFSNNIYIRFKPGTQEETISNYFQNSNFKFQRIIPLESSVLWKFQNSKKIDNYTLSNLSRVLEAEEPLLRTFTIELPNGADPIKFCEKIKRENPNVEIAEPIYLDIPLGIPNDPYASQQTLLATIKAFQTWDVFQGDTNVVIGIIDTGVFQDHEDLVNSIATNWNEIPNNGVDDDGNGYVDDFRGYNLAFPAEGKGGNTYHPTDHGTSVAGIAGATTNNNLGIAGVAYKCRIFPIKASKITNLGSIDYGYRGILYAAVRGFSVVNCSWGSPKQPSPIDQSIIDYAIARGVVIVAAGGNDDNASRVWYPAGYRGVLGVGEVNQSDYVTTTTTMNETIKIMAPGVGNWIIDNQQGKYEPSKNGGTSFAAPVVAGVVAMVRAKYPELGPLETIEYVRQLTDDISANNPSFERMVPGRVDMEKMLHIPPSSIPGISLVRLKTYRTNLVPEERFWIGDTVVLKIDAKNYLASANNLRFVLSVADIFDNSLEIIDSEFELPHLPAKADFEIGPFSLRIKEENSERTFLRVDIFGENGYKDFFLVPFVPTTYLSNFGNDSIKFSISDKGTLGFYGKGKSILGMGIRHTKLGNQLFNGGLMVSEDSSRVVTALFGLTPDRSDFKVVKPFTNPDKEIGKVNDDLAPALERIGLEIQQTVYVPPQNENYFKITLNVKNISNRIQKNISLGYYLDWDVGSDSDSNRTYLMPEAVPNTIVPIAAAVQFTESSDSSIVVGVGVLSEDANNKPQSAGLNSSVRADFSKDKQLLALNSGTAWQFNGYDDVANVCGMRFPAELNPNETKSFIMMFAIARSKEELKTIFLTNILKSDVTPDNSNLWNLEIYPNPVQNKLEMVFPEKLQGNCKIEIFNSIGELVMFEDVSLANNFYEMLLPKLPKGIYFVRVKSQELVLFGKFVKM
jgi:hypothetical protein